MLYFYSSFMRRDCDLNGALCVCSMFSLILMTTKGNYKLFFFYLKSKKERNGWEIAIEADQGQFKEFLNVAQIKCVVMQEPKNALWNSDSRLSSLCTFM